MQCEDHTSAHADFDRMVASSAVVPALFHKQWSKGVGSETAEITKAHVQRVWCSGMAQDVLDKSRNDWECEVRSLFRVHAPRHDGYDGVPWRGHGGAHHKHVRRLLAACRISRDDGCRGDASLGPCVWVICSLRMVESCPVEKCRESIVPSLKQVRAMSALSVPEH